MDDDEIAILVASTVFTLIASIVWYRNLWRFGPQAGKRIAISLAIMPPICLLFLFLVLRIWADPQVRDEAEYLALFEAMGGNVVALMASATPIILGVGVRDDALERRNGAVAAVVCGAMLGVTFTFAGANIGTGPTIWTTIGPAFLALFTLAVTWCVHALLSGASEAIAIERDPAAAVRMIGFQTASACVLGNAVAGDWVSSEATMHDFICKGWPVLVMLAVAVTIERLYRRWPWKARRRVGAAFVLAAIDLVAAAVVVNLVAAPNHGVTS